MASTEFIKCKLCGKNFLIVKRPHVPMEKLCYDCCGVPELNPFIIKREFVRITEYGVILGTKK